LNPTIILFLLIFTSTLFIGCGTATKSVTTNNAGNNNNSTVSPVKDAFIFKINSGENREFILPAQFIAAMESSWYVEGVEYDWKIDWGDGTEEEEHSGISAWVTGEIGSYTRHFSEGIFHLYPEANKDYTIKIRPNGPATKDWLQAFGWSDDYAHPSPTVMDFENRAKLKAILSPFPENSKSNFTGTFMGCTGLTVIPENLFENIKNSLTDNMFWGTFAMTGIKSIPEGLFKNISSTVSGMFQATFAYCVYLESIPVGLFKNINGSPTDYMFTMTFFACSELKTIPQGLFSSISGRPAEYMFAQTFYGCASLTSIPNGLFGDISGPPAEGMFLHTFAECSNLKGESATMKTPEGYKKLYEVFTDASIDHVGGCYAFTDLSDLDQMDMIWKYESAI